MFRENETSRIAAVLEAKLAGDAEGAVAAAGNHWLAEPESGSEKDYGGDEIWQALEELGATQAAVAHGIELIRHQRLRPLAFVDILERTSDKGVLLELTATALERKWPAELYGAAAFDRLVRLKHTKELKSLIDERSDRLIRSLDTWILVGFTMMTSVIGDRHQIDRWMQGWEDRENVPMWFIAAYVGSIVGLGGDSSVRLAQIANRALASLEPDATAPFLESFARIDELRDGRLDEFAASASRINDLRSHLESPILGHPIVVYANRVKRARQIGEDDFFSRDVDGTAVVFGAVGVAIALSSGAPERPPDWVLVELMQDLQARGFRHVAILSHFVEMLGLKRGDPRAVELCREMARSRPKEVPALIPIWAKLVKKRVGIFGRIKLALA